MRITPKDIYPPARVTDLDAAIAPQEGTVLLQWTAPDEDNLPQPANDPVKEYFVRIATFAAADLAGDATAWWNQAADVSGEPFPPLPASQVESFLVTGLEPGATIYFGLKSADEKGNLSLIDALSESGPQARAQAPDNAPPAVTGLAAAVSSAAVSLSWSASTAADVNAYRIYWDTAAPADVFTATVTLSASATSYVFSNLTAFNTYFFTVTAVDKGQPQFPGDALESTPSATVSAFVSGLVAPAAVGAVAISTHSIVWQWLDQTDIETGFNVYSTTGGLLGQTAASAGSGGTAQFAQSGLAPNSTYSIFVRAFNGSGESLSSGATSRFTLANPPAGSSFSGVFITSAAISWSANANPAGTLYVLERSGTSGFDSVDLSTTTSALVYADAGLSAFSTYYYRIKARNQEGADTAYDAALSTRTRSAPIGLIATAGDRKVLLDWNNSELPDLAGYFIYRSTAGAQGPFDAVNLTALTTSFYADTGLTNGVTYYYAVATVNTSSILGPLSEVVAARPRKSVPPQEPLGVTGSLNESVFTLAWSPVTMDVSGSTDVQLAGYRIFKSSAMEGPFLLRALVPPTTHSWTAAELVPPTVWYMIRALDTSDNESTDSLLIETVPSPSLVATSEDRTASVIFSAEDVKVLYAKGNELSEDLRIRVTRRSEEELGTIINSYDVRSYAANSGKEVKDMNLTKPRVELRFRYMAGVKGAYVSPKASFRFFSGSPKDVGIFWHNSVEFVKFGGGVDEGKGTVSIKTAKPLGRFQVRSVLRSTEFTLNQLTPRKIFTPNGDGVNDDIILFLENPKESILSQAKIYDLTGAEVAEFEQGVVAGSQAVISLKWNGKGKDGNFVRSGVYVYQIKAEGKVINGTIVVAR